MFRKKPKVEKTEFERKKTLLTSFDKMEYFIVENKENDGLLRICDNILGGKPVLANFDKLNVSDCNYMLAFISGVVYACEGETMQLGQKLFLFARKEEYEDGSLRQYVEDIK